jgi:hypothetical protein
VFYFLSLFDYGCKDSEYMPYHTGNIVQLQIKSYRLKSFYTLKRMDKGRNVDVGQELAVFVEIFSLFLVVFEHNAYLCIIKRLIDCFRLVNYL